MEFDWDTNNIAHIARHNVTLTEAEESLLDSRRIGIQVRQGSGESRWGVLGRTEAGRILFVVFTRRNSQIRVVTARDATNREKQRYRR